MAWFWIIFVSLGIISLFLSLRRKTAQRRSELLPKAGQATMTDVERLAQAGELDDSRGAI